MDALAPHGFFAAVADMAEKLRHTIITLGDEERSPYVQRLVTERQIVFGVWPDPEATLGFGFHLIKGEEHLSAPLGRPDERTTVAIPCVGLEQAVMAQEAWGKVTLTESPPAPKKKARKAAARPKAPRKEGPRTNRKRASRG